jgi:hypothetical protein
MKCNISAVKLDFKRISRKSCAVLARNLLNGFVSSMQLEGAGFSKTSSVGSTPAIDGIN